MIEWVIAFGAFTVIFLITTCTLAVRCLSMYEDMGKIERANADLRYSVKELKAENDRLRSSQDANQITTLKLALHMKQEKIDAMQDRLEKQNMLLRQKWEASKGGRKI